MVRRSIQFLAIPALASFWSCSVIIDVPPDCEDSDCRPYVCGDDGIQCLDDCTTNAECGDGFVCDQPSSTCVATGCLPQFDPVVMEGLPTAVGEYEIRRTGGTGEPAQLLFLGATGNGLGFSRFYPTGDPVVGDPVDPALGLIRLAESNEGRVPFMPEVRWASEADTAASGGDPRFIMTWRAAAGVQQLVEVGSFSPFGSTPPSVRTAYTTRADVDAVTVQPATDGLTLAWSQGTGIERDVRALPTAIDGEPVFGANANIISDDNRSGTLPNMIRAGDVRYVAFVQAGGGERKIVARGLDVDANVIGHVELRSGSATEYEVVDLATSSTGRTGVVFWVERSGDAQTLMRAELNDAVSALLSPDQIVTTRGSAVANGFSRIDRMTATDADEGYIVAWVGTRNGVTDLWVQRFAEANLASYAPMALNIADIDDLTTFSVTDTPNGIGVSWQMVGAEQTHHYQSFVCAW